MVGLFEHFPRLIKQRKPDDTNFDWVLLREQIVISRLNQQILSFYIVFLVALFALFFLVLVFSKRSDPPSATSILLFVIVIFTIGLPLFSKISLSKDGGGVETVDPLVLIDRLEAKAEAARNESLSLLTTQIGALSQQVSETIARFDDVAGATAAESTSTSKFTLRDARRLLPAPTVQDDPQKGRFGGSSESQRRRLSASVEPSNFGRPWQKVTIVLECVDGVPFSDSHVYFFLHDTFEPDVYRVKADRGGLTARLETSATGAFTVGIVAEEGSTKLELDLASESVKAPLWWKKL